MAGKFDQEFFAELEMWKAFLVFCDIQIQMCDTYLFSFVDSFFISKQVSFEG